MNLAQLSWNNLKAKPLTSFLSLLLLTMGVAMIALLVQVNREISAQFEKNLAGIDMVVGAKGSPLQLILSSMYHIDAPTGNISWAEAQQLMKHPMVSKGVPLAYGDNYQGFRILGTTTEYLDLYEATDLQAGKLWAKSMEVTLGSSVAKATGLQVGDEFFGAHGLALEGETHDHHGYRVGGILKPSGSVADQLILTNLQSVWHVHEHDGGAQPDSLQDITALLLQFRNKMALFQLPRQVNQNTSMQAALPAMEVNRLFDLLGVGIETLHTIAFLIMLISGISVFVSLYNSLRERRYELALLRVLGAGPGKLFRLIVLEGMLLSLGGFALGLLLSRIGFAFMAISLQGQMHYELAWNAFGTEEVWLLLGVLGIGFLASLIPAWMAYRTDISLTLSES